MHTDLDLPIDGGHAWKAALREFILNPNDETWDELAHKIIPSAQGKTMWQAWVAVDPRAPRSTPSGPIGEHWPAEQRWQGRRPSVFQLVTMLEKVWGRKLSSKEIQALVRKTEKPGA